jgi:hypothetical protein
MAVPFQEAKWSRCPLGEDHRASRDHRRLRHRRQGRAAPRGQPRPPRRVGRPGVTAVLTLASTEPQIAVTPTPAVEAD